ncbi:hypothetical protein [Cellulomonas sp. PhB143]|uniref:hypothetical protein n=1 Tax=Cellulomonas sp. PhB143 TaxID=2485186 RepID=UPI000F472121|nr:hypothetical protein [Cellulomonas sp. PhB143]ROS76639.1 very-short-patch-repair endonuclease [Cellulomonas sp. PhB143]
MPRARAVPPALQGRPVPRDQALEHVTRGALEGPAYRRVTRGVWAPADLPADHGTRLAAVRLALGPDAVLTGASAAWALGSRLAGAEDPAECALATRHVRNRPELVVRRETVGPSDRTDHPRFGLITSPARTVVDLARRGSGVEAVVAVDSLLQACAISASEVARAVDRLRGARGVRAVQQVLDLADRGSESPQETRLRLLLRHAGLPHPRTQHVVCTTDGAFVARVDLAWPLLRVAVEYDGAHHDSPEQIRRDRDRLNRLRLVGWTVLVVDRHQMRAPSAVVAMVGAALRDAQG